MKTLEDLLFPVTLESFFEKHWSEFLYIRNMSGKTGDKTDLITVSEIDNIIRNSQPFARNFEVISDGLAQSQSGITSFRDVCQHFQLGHSFRFLNIDHFNDNLRRLCADIASRTSSKVNANLYVTPPGSAGLNPHFDTHNVFVLQLYGKKTWKLYSCDAVPPAPIKNLLNGGLSEHDKTITHELVMSPGDVMFIPRGLVHSATSLQETSIHLTVRAVTYKVVDVITALASVCANDSAEFREDIPPCTFSSGSAMDGYSVLSGQIKAALSKMSSTEQITKSLGAMHLLQNEISNRRCREGAFEQLVKSPDGTNDDFRISQSTEKEFELYGIQALEDRYGYTLKDEEIRVLGDMIYDSTTADRNVARARLDSVTFAKLISIGVLEKRQ